MVLQPISECVGEGFALGLIVWLLVWGLTLPIRWVTKHLGL